MGEMKAALPARSFIRRWSPLALRYVPLACLLAAFAAVALLAGGSVLLVVSWLHHSKSAGMM
jgi:hypothetical protein